MLPLLPTHWLTSKGRHQRGKIEMKKENEQREREREGKKGSIRLTSRLITKENSFIQKIRVA